MKFLKKEKGFTLIELLVVVSIIGVLASIVLSSLGEARNKAKDAKILSQVRELQKAIEAHNLFEGSWPTDGPNDSVVWASTCEGFSESRYVENWNAFIDDLGEYAHESFKQQVTGEQEACYWYATGVTNVYCNTDPEGYTLLFGTYATDFNSFESYDNAYGTLFCLKPL
ncbi:MAG: type II secretion system GspH family protein [Candidatus Pacebacteria bacterium]|nr:type II secretion system GspH family protein [Candidatus Paceibacterota bacterium]